MMLVAKRMLCTILIAVLTMGCYEPTSDVNLDNRDRVENSIPIQLANPFSLKLNQTVLIESENLELKLLEINDSRCPSGVQCPWAGLVNIVLSVTTDDRDTESIAIAQRGDDSASKTFNGYSIELIEVSPYPQKDRTIENEDYSATLVVSHK